MPVTEVDNLTKTTGMDWMWELEAGNKYNIKIGGIDNEKAQFFSLVCRYSRGNRFPSEKIRWQKKRSTLRKKSGRKACSTPIARVINLRLTKL